MNVKILYIVSTKVAQKSSFTILMLSQPRVSPPELPFPREWTFHQTAIIVTHRNHLQRNSTMKITKLLRFQIWKFSQKRILAQIINNVSLIVAQLFSVLGVAIRNWECACHMGENKNTKKGGQEKNLYLGISTNTKYDSSLDMWNMKETFPESVCSTQNYSILDRTKVRTCSCQNAWFEMKNFTENSRKPMINAI